MTLFRAISYFLRPGPKLFAMWQFGIEDPVMTVAFQCHACGKQLRVPEEKAGRKGRCPMCSALIRIPNSTAPSHPVEEILEVVRVEASSGIDQPSIPQTTNRGADRWEVSPERIAAATTDFGPIPALTIQFQVVLWLALSLGGAFFTFYVVTNNGLINADWQFSFPGLVVFTFAGAFLGAFVGAVSSAIRLSGINEKIRRCDPSVFPAIAKAASVKDIRLLALGLTDERRKVRMATLNAMLALRAEAAPALPLIINVLRRKKLNQFYYDSSKESGTKRCNACGTRLTMWNAAMGPGSRGKCAACANAESDGSPSERALAARVLGRIGHAASAAVPELKIALRDPDEDLHDEARRALKRIEQ